MVEFSARNQVIVQLAYYPPYHSKYNPIERVFGVLENHWNGDPLITVEAALGMAQSMTYRAVPPQASLHEGGIKGTRLPVKIMKIVEKGLERIEGLRKWFVKIIPEKAQEVIGNLGETRSEI